MKKEQLHIEDLFKQSFEGYRIEPSPNLWTKINMKLNLYQFFKAGFGHFNIYYSVLVVGLLTTLSLYINNRSDEKPVITNISIQAYDPSNDKLINVQDNKNSDEKNTINQNTDLKQIIYSKEIELNAVSKETGKDSANKPHVTFVENIDPVLIAAKDSAHQIKSIVTQQPKPLFTLTNKEGCVPFELGLKNLSQGANEFYWTFGDGGSSNAKEPVYTYMYPGVYQIQLKATGPGGSSYSVIDSIIIHDKPSVKAFWPYQSDFFVGEQIIIPVETQNAKRFEWDFGDGGIINKKQAEYSYQSVGDYTITLKSWSEHNCFDSIKIVDLKVVNNDSKLVFPSAFCPNPDGPSNGKYYDKETHVDIFHPIIKGKLTQYQLVIYSRTGGVVFESDDEKTGWDGYFENKLMPQGVYPFIVKGKFDGGSEFLHKGNVTLLYRK